MPTTTLPPINEARLVQLFLNLCSINSPALAEADVVAWAKGHLCAAGLEVHEDDAGAKIGGTGNNLIVWLRGTLADAPKVFLSAHFDTVEPTDGLSWEEQAGVFRSTSDTILGADDYAGMAPAVEAILALKESGQPHGDVCLLLSVAEEIGLKGASVLDVENLGLDFGFVLDTGPPVGSYVTRTATHDKLEFTIRGKPAHAGKDPEKGINAIQVVAAAVHDMRLGRIAPETTANLGMIQGGTGSNVVCPSVTIRAEARSTSVEDLDAQVDHMIQKFEAAAREFGATVEVVHDRHYRSYEVSEATTVVQIGQAASRSLGLEPTLRTTLGGSDANVYNAKGLPCIVMATGMTDIHTHSEHVSRADLVLTARLALACLLEVAAPKHRKTTTREH
ncbi:MAG: M20/M25/M40 family metallo-hydrolase [Fimbriimonadaceae bacterium]